MKKTTQPTLLAFHGDPKIKAKYIARVKAHAKMDQIIQGTGFDPKTSRGCAIGCTLDNYHHDSYPTELGISWRMALMEDGIFEKLPVAEAKKFPLQFLQAVPVGADTERVYKEFMLWSLEDPKDGILQFAKGEHRAVLVELIATYKKALSGEEITPETWKALGKRLYDSASASAFAYAFASAYAYAYASASASAYDYAYDYASAYASAYDYASAYAYADWTKTCNARVLIMRDKLLAMLKASAPKRSTAIGKSKAQRGAKQGKPQPNKKTKGKAPRNVR